MKKTIAFIPALLLSAFFNYSFGRSHHDTLATKESAGITTLIINADVSIMLVNKENTSMNVEIDPSLTKFITMKQSGDTLMINPVRHKYKTKGGIIWIPANQLRKIQINSEAKVRSFSRLQIPQLDVIVNGACNFKISNIGEVNLMETDNYDVEQNREVHHWPAAMFTPKK